MSDIDAFIHLLLNIRRSSHIEQMLDSLKINTSDSYYRCFTFTMLTVVRLPATR
ncbi:MAG: hypothetical protein ACOYLR_13590 [Chlorobium sp.]